VPWITVVTLKGKKNSEI